MHILMLTQFFHPEPFFKGLPFARELHRRGHEVEVLTGFPNYPGGHVYPGYQIRLRQTEQIDGITVHRVPLYPSHDRSAIRRLGNYGSFALSAALLGPLVIRDPDVIYAYHPPVTSGAAARWLSLMTAAPVVYDVQDLWPDTVAATGMMRSPSALRILKRLCASIYRSMDRVTVLSPGFRNALLSLGVDESRVDVIYNWSDETAPVASDSSSAILADLNRMDGFKVLFAGTMGLAQHLDTVLDAAQICRVRGSRARFILLGGGIETDRLRLRAETSGLANVHFFPRISPGEMPPVLAAADALLVHLLDDPLFEITIPSKTQAYLAAGKPILMAVKGDAADLVKRSHAGLCCAPGNASALAAAVETLAAMPASEREQMGLRGKSFYQRELSLASGASKFETAFETAIRARENGRTIRWKAAAR